METSALHLFDLPPEIWCSYIDFLSVCDYRNLYNCCKTFQVLNSVTPYALLKQRYPFCDLDSNVITTPYDYRSILRHKMLTNSNFEHVLKFATSLFDSKYLFGGVIYTDILRSNRSRHKLLDFHYQVCLLFDNLLRTLPVIDGHCIAILCSLLTLKYGRNVFDIIANNPSTHYISSYNSTKSNIIRKIHQKLQDIDVYSVVMLTCNIFDLEPGIAINLDDRILQLILPVDNVEVMLTLTRHLNFRINWLGILQKNLLYTCRDGRLFTSYNIPCNLLQWALKQNTITFEQLFTHTLYFVYKKDAKIPIYLPVLDWCRTLTPTHVEILWTILRSHKHLRTPDPTLLLHSSRQPYVKDALLFTLRNNHPHLAHLLIDMFDLDQAFEADKLTDDALLLLVDLLDIDANTEVINRVFRFHLQQHPNSAVMTTLCKYTRIDLLESLQPSVLFWQQLMTIACRTSDVVVQWLTTGPYYHLFMHNISQYIYIACLGCNAAVVEYLLHYMRSIDEISAIDSVTVSHILLLTAEERNLKIASQLLTFNLITADNIHSFLSGLDSTAQINVILLFLLSAITNNARAVVKTLVQNYNMRQVLVEYNSHYESLASQIIVYCLDDQELLHKLSSDGLDIDLLLAITE